MGDRRRFAALADFIAISVQRGARVLDVAGGQGYLALALAERGYRCTVLDPRVTGLSRAERVEVRRGRRRGFERVVARLDSTMDIEAYDLLVGLHPDQATEAIANAATRRPVVLVPCCRYWSGMDGHGIASISECIRRRWRALGIAWREENLPIKGRNLVMQTVPM